ncbi:MAG: hypothetical protein OXB99_16850 [Acidimicrobiaceae bacterium]|nr:hypothetical protein [Acidimicrobiaceae bacterium]
MGGTLLGSTWLVPRRARYASAALQRLNHFQASNRFYAANRELACGRSNAATKLVEQLWKKDSL